MKHPLTLLIALIAASCSGGGGGGSLPSSSPSTHPTQRPTQTPSQIQHVVIIVQENRTVDNLFQGLPGADTQAWGLNAKNQPVNLKATPLTAPYDMNHLHPAFVADYANGQMNGWNQGGCTGKCPPSPGFAYVPRSEIAPYWTLATRYTFADRMFQSNQGPSLPAHQYLLSGSSSLTDNPWPKASENAPAGCDVGKQVTVTTIDEAGSEAGSAWPCFTRNSVLTLLDRAGLAWSYYQSSNRLWQGPRALSTIYGTPEYATNVITPPAQFITDVTAGNLASVAFVTPTGNASDHAVETDGSGPAWVASVVNAIGESPFWNTTTIFIVWDDWGGWYDHVVPPIRNSYELGFRVPLIVVSPYAKLGYVSHAQHEFGSILHYTEESFNLPSMNTTDALSDDLSDCFNYNQSPTPFTPLPGGKKAKYWHNHSSTREIDY